MKHKLMNPIPHSAPKATVDHDLIDKQLTEAIEDVRRGRVYGPFSSAKEIIQSLRREARRLRKR